VKRLIAWFATNPVAANFMLIVAVVGGLFTGDRIRQEVFPEVRIERVIVQVPYPGAAPEEVEEGICVKVEEAVQGVEGIRRMTSTAAEGMGVVVIELERTADVERALDDVKAEIDAIDTFPEEAEEPTVSQAVMRTQVVTVALSGDVAERTLRELGQRVRDEIVALPGITHAELAGVRDYEMSIEVSEVSLRRHGLTFDDVVRAIRRSSLDLPGGSIKTRGGEVLLRTKGQAYRAPDFEKIVLVSRADGTRLLLGQVARVVDGFEDADVVTRFDGAPAVLVQVFRVGDQGALDVAAAVKAYVADAKDRLPVGVSLTTWEDNSLLLRARLNTLVSNARIGFVLVLVVLALFLRLRLAFWVGIGVPVAILGTLWVMPMLDVSLNLMSLFAFLLVLGILVDDAIVVGENVHTHQQRTRDPLRGAIDGTSEVAIPVIFGVLTTVAAFFPLLVIPGAMGKITASIPLVVVTALTFSLIESQLILPSHLAHGDPGGVARTAIGRWWGRVQDGVADRLQRFIQNVYHPVLRRALEWRLLTVACAFGVIVITIGLERGGWARFVFFPNVESDNVIAFVTMPLGTPATTTAEAIRALETSAQAVVRELDAESAAESGSIVHHMLTSVGRQPFRERQDNNRGGRAGPRLNSGHLGEVNIELAPAELRRISSGEIAARWREKAGPIPDAVEVVFVSSLFSAGEAINVELRGTNVERLSEAAEMLKARLAAVRGVFDVSDSYRGGKEELKLRVKPVAEAQGLALADLARQVRQAFYGEEVQRVQRGRDDVRVMVRYPETSRRSVGDLEGMRIRMPDGRAMPLSAVAAVDRGRGYAVISRSDRQRVVSVTADVDETVTTANDVVAALRETVLPEVLAAHPGVTYSLQGEQREQAEFLSNLLRQFMTAMLMIFGLLAIPLGSYVQPLIIMTAIPFGMVGAIFGHLLMGSDLSMFSVIGMVALSGVVVNDSLVLVDYVNRRVRDGASVVEAATSSGSARFRAILLTSLTTFAGLLPLLLERSLQAQFLIPMAISLAFGVLFATVVTLVLVPTLYLLLDDVQGTWRRWRHGTDETRPDVTDAPDGPAPVRAIPPRRHTG